MQGSGRPPVVHEERKERGDPTGYLNKKKEGGKEKFFSFMVFLMCRKGSPVA